MPLALRYLTFNRHFLRRLLTGAVLRAPLHIRPWIGIRPHTSTKGMGYGVGIYQAICAFPSRDTPQSRGGVL